jgi:hypothetical protein
VFPSCGQYDYMSDELLTRMTSGCDDIVKRDPGAGSSATKPPETHNLLILLIKCPYAARSPRSQQ